MILRLIKKHFSNDLIKNLRQNAIAFSNQLGIKLRSIQKKSIQLPDIKLTTSDKIKQLKQKLVVKQDQFTFLHPNGFYCQQQLQQRKTTKDVQKHNFQLYEFMRGQIGLQYKPLQQQLLYKQKVQKRKKWLDQQYAFNFLNKPTRKVRKSLLGYHKGLQEWKKQILLRQQYEDTIKMDIAIRNYPGSKLGNLPQDDPASFTRWIKGQVDGTVLKRFSKRINILIKSPKIPLQTKIQMGLYKQFSGVKYTQIQKIDSKTIQDIKNRRNKKIQKQKQQLGSQKHTQNIYYYQNLFIQQDCTPPTNIQPDRHVHFTHNVQKRPQQMMPQFPPTMGQRFRQILDDYHNWKVMTQKLNDQHLQKNMLKHCYPIHNQKPKLKSLYPYYKTLPKHLQDNATIQHLYMILQHRHPNTQLIMKQKLLNQLCQIIQPIDQISTRVLHAGLGNKKLTLKEQKKQRIRKLKPKQLNRPPLFMDIVYKQQKQQYQYIDPDWKDGQQPKHCNSLPVDYYINHDGFWDQYIAEKQKRYNQTPLYSKGGRKFKH